MKKNLLIIGDSKSFHTVIEAIFAENHSAFFADTQEKAFSALEKNPISLIILTPKMRGQDSFRFLTALRSSKKRFSDVPALFAGHILTPELIARARKCDVSDVIKLPFDPIDFENKALELLRLHAPSRERPDPVTGLPKRFLGEARISEMLKEGKKGALMLVDLDYLSFACTDMNKEALITCRDVLQEEINTDGVLSITKTDGFIVFVPGLRERDKIQQYGENLIKKILERTKPKNDKEKIFVSVGLAVSERHGRNYEDLYLSCDKGLGEARKNGKNIARFYTW
jgi:PleD family two-component response regulator